MPADLTVTAVTPTVAQPPPRTHAQIATTQAFLPPSTPPAASRQASASSAAIPDNRVVLDPTSDRVVLEYFDATGALVNSLPSQRQLDAYRLAASLPPATEVKKP